MELLILCAGAGVKDWGGAKSDRPLRTKGKRQAQKIGAWLGKERLRPDLVLVSGSLRARISAEKALKAAGWTAGNIQCSEALSAGSLPDLPESGTALLVAPSSAVRQLALELGCILEAAPGVLFRLRRGPRKLSLIRRIDAFDLPDLFPYPAPDGPACRERPAYYYSQSAVIPYRRTAAGLEILVVGSSSGRHLVVPKGIVEPGLSPAASARVEAREEAGVEGRFGKTQLGTYSYEKWGATCEVIVFGMEVTRVLPETEWEEGHRTRKWVSPSVAALRLNQPALGAMIAKIEA
ncbi:NUDIX domain-containing protein [Roseibium polysiphoniae]|uniref:NUDIX domain-containing protein n=1 Tax=Roseibium polysiphoniae TaxID=2571221 RepID=A0ABR9CBU0_9HYPH|nr:NUDIX domain-containing protein [Roseibium polysiphoniae]MBD8877361.1 NUDIX domain-containing protein [Roseibium polysiphoniae]